MDAQFWDELYREHRGSDTPNGVLVTEVTGLPPGRALDVGCGEGADALWLARQGWQVTAVDISRVALERAATHAAAFTDAATWAYADLHISAPPVDACDLVSVQYFPLPRQPEHAALRRLLAAVAPGGTLLVVRHDTAGQTAHHSPGSVPNRYYQPHEIAGLLRDDWTVLVDETRPRAAPAVANHTHDTVLRARRLR